MSQYVQARNVEMRSNTLKGIRLFARWQKLPCHPLNNSMENNICAKSVTLDRVRASLPALLSDRLLCPIAIQNP
jgi:hypothetical protein